MSSDFKSNSFLYGTNETYLAQMFARYLQDPRSVGPEWLDVFQDLGEDEKSFLTEQQGASWAPRSLVRGGGEAQAAAGATPREYSAFVLQDDLGVPLVRHRE